MNSETGRMITGTEMEKMLQLQKSKYIEIEEAAMTLKQKQQMQVSKYDNRTPLGKLRYKTFNNLRNKPCPLCNSGKKFKKCCWNESGIA